MRGLVAVGAAPATQCDRVHVVPGHIRAKPSSKPDGALRKVMNNDRIHALGWQHRTQLKMGLRQAYEWFSKNQDLARR